MDKRDIDRFNIKYGKFFDPLIILVIVVMIATPVLAVKNLSPRVLPEGEISDVLGVQDGEESVDFELIVGEHNYITSEKLNEISPSHFKYTALVKKPPQGRISKPIVEIQGLNKDAVLKTELMNSSSHNSKISVYDSSGDTKYILQEKLNSYSQNIKVNKNTDTFYLVIENENPVLFNQYIELRFFLNF